MLHSSVSLHSVLIGLQSYPVHVRPMCELQRWCLLGLLIAVQLHL